MPINNSDYYLNYLNVFSTDEVREDSNPIRNKIIECVNDLLMDYNNFIVQNYKEYFPFLAELKEEDQKFVEESFFSCIVASVDLYTAILTVNQKNILHIDKEKINYEDVNSYLENDEKRAKLTSKYDFMPIIEQIVENVFFTIAEKLDTILNMQYLLVENLRVFLGYIIENTFIICDVCLGENA
jgi:pyruvate-formate lyase